DLLAEVHARYNRPLLIAETGSEDRVRPGWLRYVCRVAQAALAQGVPLHGLFLYPILNHPGWVDDRHCYNGLWDYADKNGEREIYEPLEAEIHLWQQVFDARDRDRISPRVVEIASASVPKVNGKAHGPPITGPVPGCGKKSS